MCLIGVSELVLEWEWDKRTCIIPAGMEHVFAEGLAVDGDVARIILAGRLADLHFGSKLLVERLFEADFQS